MEQSSVPELPPVLDGTCSNPSVLLGKQPRPPNAPLPDLSQSSNEKVNNRCRGRERVRNLPQPASFSGDDSGNGQ